MTSGREIRLDQGDRRACRHAGMHADERKAQNPAFKLTSDAGISAGRRQAGSVNEIDSIRACVDDVGCTTNDGGPLRIGPDCIVFEAERLARIIISVAEMPCTILEVSGLQRNSALHGEKYAHIFAQQLFQQRIAQGARGHRELQE